MNLSHFDVPHAGAANSAHHSLERKKQLESESMKVLLGNRTVIDLDGGNAGKHIRSASRETQGLVAGASPINHLLMHLMHGY